MSSDALREEARENVEDMLSKLGYPAEGRRPLSQLESDLRYRLVKYEKQLLKKNQEILSLQQKCSSTENRLERWREFLESAMARNRENAELKREIKKLREEIIRLKTKAEIPPLV